MSRYPELAAKVDGFFTRVQDRHGADMACGTGCSHCCHTRLTVTGVEGAAITAHVGTWSAAQRTELAANVAVAAPDRCTALDAAGRCLIYAVRPIVAAPWGGLSGFPDLCSSGSYLRGFNSSGVAQCVSPVFHCDTVTAQGTGTNQNATCPAGTELTGGGCFGGSSSNTLWGTYNATSGSNVWTCIRTGTTSGVIAYALCCQITE
jgi:hypothetical protein